MVQSRLLRGTFILTAAIFFSKFLGLIFVIPFQALVGLKGVALYGYAYVPYTIILNAATLGLPLAVSKFVSKYNAMGDYRTSRRLFHSGILVTACTGMFAFLLLFWLAPKIVPFIVGSRPDIGNSQEDVVHVIRLVSTALMIVPTMSVIRGYFQGFQSMGPTAMSQIVEQMVRVLFLLGGTFFVLQVFGGSISTAVGFATFAAFVGAFGGLIVLVRYWMKRKKHLDRQVQESRHAEHIPFTAMYRELGSYAIPFVVAGLAIPLFQLVDEFTINQTLMELGFSQKYAENVFAFVDQLSHKLTMIPVALATALAVALVPAITNSFTAGKIRELHHQMTQAFQIVLFLTIPAAVGLSLLAFPVYGTLYGMEHVKEGGLILRWYAPTALLFALFAMTSSILQGINRQKFAVFSLLVGLLLKMVLNEWLLRVAQGVGAVIATDVGFICSVALNVIAICVFSNYHLGFIAKRALLIFVFSMAMAVVVSLVIWLLGSGFAVPGSYLQSLWTLVFGVAAGVGCYFWIVVRTHLAKQIFGNRFSFLRRRG